MGIVVLGVIAVGAMLLAVLSGQLTRPTANSDGGLHASLRHELGEFAGHLVGWSYWVQPWAGNAAIVASWVFPVDALFGLTVDGVALTGKKRAFSSVNSPERSAVVAAVLGHGHLSGAQQLFLPTSWSLQP
jgi:amino acid transporter